MWYLSRLNNTSITHVNLNVSVFESFILVVVYQNEVEQKSKVTEEANYCVLVQK
ncbi:hypothetical protein M565_ctg1P1189 [Vibrio cyclitrophicus FF75]|nr:hypothetical protein M565_ctg1P1189 [Vibrio cyclitrophicus FF75]